MGICRDNLPTHRTAVHTHKHIADPEPIAEWCFHREQSSYDIILQHESLYLGSHEMSCQGLGKEVALGRETLSRLGLIFVIPVDRR